jgi:hypothetical protein
MVADLLIFDPQNVHAIADYLDPIRLAEGFDVVIVNGRIAREGPQPNTIMPWAWLCTTLLGPSSMVLAPSNPS